MKPLYRASRWPRSCARSCARNWTCWVNHDAVSDVSPPIVDPASAAMAEREAGSIAPPRRARLEVVVKPRRRERGHPADRRSGERGQGGKVGGIHRSSVSRAVCSTVEQPARLDDLADLVGALGDEDGAAEGTKE